MRSYFHGKYWSQKKRNCTFLTYSFTQRPNKTCAKECSLIVLE